MRTGEFVVDTGGRLVLTYRYQYGDNYPDVETLRASIHEAASGRREPPSKRA